MMTVLRACLQTHVRFEEGAALGLRRSRGARRLRRVHTYTCAWH